MYKTDRECVKELISVLSAKGVFSTAKVSEDGAHGAVFSRDMEFFDLAKSDEEIARCTGIARSAASGKEAIRKMEGAGLLNCKPVPTGRLLMLGFKRYLSDREDVVHGFHCTDSAEYGDSFGDYIVSIACATRGQSSDVTYVVLLANALTVMLNANYVPTLRMMRNQESLQIISEYVRKCADAGEITISGTHDPSELISCIKVESVDAIDGLGDCESIEMTPSVTLYASKRCVAVACGQVVRILNIPGCVQRAGVDFHKLCVMASFMMSYSGCGLWNLRNAENLAAQCSSCDATSKFFRVTHDASKP